LEEEIAWMEVEMLLGVGSVFLGLATIGQPSVTTLQKEVKASSFPS
jgi:hypothetical protein